MSSRRKDPPITTKGTVLTDMEVQRLADEAGVGYDLTKARRAGRPSLDGGQKHSPHVSFRAPAELRAKAAARAAREGKTISQLAREAFERYLAG